jgi:L-alanine-DL-glutamate epimerase-like enolase superfamily enzyme
MKVTGIETLHCDAGWRNYSFVKLTTDEGIVGWSEYDEGFGSPGVTAAIEQLAERVVGEDVSAHERIYAELYCVTRPASGGVVAEAMGDRERAA